MDRWGYDDVNGQVIGGNYLSCQLYYDNRPQKSGFCADNKDDAMKQAKTIKHDLLKDFGGHPCYLYQDDSKWELRMK